MGVGSSRRRIPQPDIQRASRQRKILLARCLPSILPRMAQQEALEVTKIYSVNGALPPVNLMVLQRQFRSPHYTISNAGLVVGDRA